MKAKGIIIYTVRLQSGSSEMLKNCATSPDYFHDVDSVSKLVAAFEDIGSSIEKLRLAR